MLTIKNNSLLSIWFGFITLPDHRNFFLYRSSIKSIGTCILWIDRYLLILRKYNKHLFNSHINFILLIKIFFIVIFIEIKMKWHRSLFYLWAAKWLFWRLSVAGTRRLLTVKTRATRRAREKSQSRKYDDILLTYARLYGIDKNNTAFSCEPRQY